MPSILRTLLLPFLVMVFCISATVAFGQNAYLDAGKPVPTVKTDREDYAPGQIARITGSGWVLDQQVHVEFKEEPDYPDFHIYDVDVDANGNWSIDYQIEQRHLGVTFTLTAIGKQTKVVAQTIFTDAAKSWDGEGGDGNWNTASNWNPNGVPTSTDDVTINGGFTVTVNANNCMAKSVKLGNNANSIAELKFALSSVLTIDGELTFGNTGNSARVGKVDMTAFSRLRCKGFVVNQMPVWIPGNGRVQFTATNTLPAAFTNFYSLDIFSGSTTLSSNINVASIFTINGGSLINTPTNNITLANDAVFGRGSNISTIAVAPNFGTSVRMQYGPSTSPITTGPEMPIAPSVLSALDIHADVILNADVTINSRINFQFKPGDQKSIIQTGNHTLTFGSNNFFIGNYSGGWINGNLRRAVTTSYSPSSSTTLLFPIGDASKYSPVTINIYGVSTAGHITASTVASENPNISSSNLDFSKSVNRHWVVTKDNTLNYSKYDIQLEYPTTENDDATVASNYIVGRYDGSTWSYPTLTGTPSSTSISATGLTDFSTFAVGKSKAIGTTTTLLSSKISSTYGESVSYTATVSPESGTSTPTGSVIFKNGESTLGTVTLETVEGIQKATYTTSALQANTNGHAITAEYQPATGTNFVASAATAFSPSTIPLML